MLYVRVTQQNCYRDAGGLPVLATNIFPNFTSAIFPCVEDRMMKATMKLTLFHPHGTVALSNMQQQSVPKVSNEHWKQTKFAQASNLPLYMFSLAILPSVYERVRRRINGRASRSCAMLTRRLLSTFHRFSGRIPAQNSAMGLPRFPYSDLTGILNRVGSF